MKKAHDDLMASLKEEHRDEIAELDSKHTSAIDGKLITSLDKTLSISSRDLFRKGEHSRKRMIETCTKYSLVQEAHARPLSGKP